MPKLIYFGNYSQVDTDESNPAILPNGQPQGQTPASTDENSSILVGKSIVGPVQYVDVTITDPEGDGVIRDDEYNGTSLDPGPNRGQQDLVTYTLAGGSSQTQITDATMTYDAKITFANSDPSAPKEQLVIVLQMTNGDVFIADRLSGPPEDQLDYKKIEKIELVSYRHENTGWNKTQDIVLCFAGDTMIAVRGGEKPASALRAGDLVATRDEGFQPVLWVFRRRYSADELAADPNRRPVRIGAGVLGQNMPRTDLLVSRQHRLLLESDEGAGLFGSPEVLAAAIKLTGQEGIGVDMDVTDITYVHIVMARHHVVYANGLPCETIYDAKMVTGDLTAWQKLELMAARPDLFQDGVPPHQARPFAETRKQIRMLFPDTPPRAPEDTADHAVAGGFI